MSTTRIRIRVNAPPAAVFRALIDPAAVAAWMVPDGMTSRVHLFEPWAGGQFRISLTYDAGGPGKTSGSTDTYHGRFVELRPPERVVQALEFETADPGLQGEMTTTFTLSEAEGGCALEAVHDNVPRGVAPADNETGWRMSLAKLARLVESRAGASGAPH